LSHRSRQDNFGGGGGSVFFFCWLETFCFFPTPMCRRHGDLEQPPGRRRLLPGRAEFHQERVAFRFHPREFLQAVA